MRALMHFAARLLRARKGATAVEYGLILALVVLAMIGALSEFASSATTLWNDVSTKVQAAH